MSKEFRFFAYLIESYAAYKELKASEVMTLFDDKGVTNFIYDMYELYHTERLENAFEDIDSLIKTGKPAW